MEHRFDVLAKSLAMGASRRDVLRQLGGGLAGALLASMGLGKAWGQSPHAASNASCAKFCRDECGIRPGGGNAFGQCVSSCQRCLNRTGAPPCACPAPGSTAVLCCGANDQCCSSGTLAGCCPEGAQCCPDFDHGTVSCCGPVGAYCCMHPSTGHSKCCPTGADCCPAADGSLNCCGFTENCVGGQCMPA
jgi:hypothetical protein